MCPFKQKTFFVKEYHMFAHRSLLVTAVIAIVVGMGTMQFIFNTEDCKAAGVPTTKPSTTASDTVSKKCDSGYRVKIFSLTNDQQDQSEINDWFKQAGEIKIVKVEQTRQNDSRTCVTVWYKEAPPFAASVTCVSSNYGPSYTLRRNGFGEIISIEESAQPMSSSEVIISPKK